MRFLKIFRQNAKVRFFLAHPVPLPRSRRYVRTDAGIGFDIYDFRRFHVLSKQKIIFQGSLTPSLR